MGGSLAWEARLAAAWSHICLPAALFMTGGRCVLSNSEEQPFTLKFINVP